MKYKPNYKHRFWSMCIIALMALALFAGALIDRNLKYQEYADLETSYLVSEGETAYYKNEWMNCKRTRDFYKSALESTNCYPGINWENIVRVQRERIEFLEGQLGSCNNAYSRELHDRLFYQNAFNNVSPYCSEGLDQLVIDGLRADLDIIVDRLDQCEVEKGLALSSRDHAIADEEAYKDLLISCRSGWDMCERPEGWRKNFQECLRWTGEGFIADADVGYCSGASWFWDSDNPGRSYDNYLYCKSQPNCTTWSD